MATQNNLRKNASINADEATPDVKPVMEGMEPERLDEIQYPSKATVDDEPVGDQALQLGIGDRNTETSAVVDQMNQPIASGKPVTGGDVDAMTEQAKVVGEEAVGGTTPTPDQSNVDDIADSAGVDFEPDEPVRVAGEMRDRDRERWELQPDSGDRPAHI